MNLGNILIKVEQGISLAQLLFGGIHGIVGAIRAGKASATNTHTGEALTADDVLAAVSRAQTADLATGDAAEDRIEDRHGDGA